MSVYQNSGFSWQKNVISERCKGVHCVDLGESFPTHILLQNLASIQPITIPVKFARSPRTDPPGSIFLHPLVPALTTVMNTSGFRFGKLDFRVCFRMRNRCKHTLSSKRNPHQVARLYFALKRIVPLGILAAFLLFGMSGVRWSLLYS